MAENQAPQASVQTVVVPAEAPSIDKGLVVRSIVYLILIVNSVAAHFGLAFHLNGNEEFIYQVVSDVLLVLSFVQAYWKNNNISKAARIIDKVAEQVDVFAGQNPVPEKYVPSINPVPAAPVAEAPKAEAPVAAPAQPAEPQQPVNPQQ